MDKDLIVLSSIIHEPTDGSAKCWTDAGRYAKRGSRDRVPKPELQRLAAEGYVEVETRRCSVWTFGPKYPSFYKPHGYTDAQWDQVKQDYQQWHADNPRHWKDRSEVWARPTAKGIGYASLMGLLD